VLTHHRRDPLRLSDTTFLFVTEGPEKALELAREAAGSKDVMLRGGANAARQYLAAGLVDEMEINLAPMFLGAGERLFEGVGPLPELEHVRTISTSAVTHLLFRRRGQ
jgi:dihydrofolate reductase